MLGQHRLARGKETKGEKVLKEILGKDWSGTIEVPPQLRKKEWGENPAMLGPPPQGIKGTGRKVRRGEVQSLSSFAAFRDKLPQFLYPGLDALEFLLQFGLVYLKRFDLLLRRRGKR